MNKVRSHIIRRQSIDITFDDMDNAMGLQNDIAALFYEKLQPRMEALLDEMFGKDHYASVERLEIDCGLLNKKNWEEEFTEQAIRALKKELAGINKKAPDLKRNAAGTFLFFLENGILPWNRSIKDIAELEQLIGLDAQLLAKLKNLISRKPATADRLVRQFSKKFTAELIRVLTQGREKKLEDMRLVLNRSGIDQQLADTAMIEIFIAGEGETETVQHVLALIYNKAPEHIKPAIRELQQQSAHGNDPVRQPIIKGTGMKKEALTQEIYISNAGLVIVHPFLEALFGNLELTAKNKWVDEGAQHKAVLVLELLATGLSETAEFDLPLNKILCGLDVDELVITGQALGDEIKNECEAVLRNIILHWRALKNTSTAGLREAFLQRNGKLSPVDNGWRLQVEQKGMDVLLGSLPWGTGVIKLPWMQGILFVEWT